MLVDEKFENVILVFSRKYGADCNPWDLQVKTAFRWRELMGDVREISLDTKINETALSHIILTIQDNTPRAMQECEMKRDFLKELQKWYSGITVINKLLLLQHSPNTGCKRRENMWDHIAVLEAQYTQLATARSELDDSLKMEILLATWTYLNEYKPLVSSISIMDREDAT